uniref:hypothetical protein n=1 Tax=Klebsiella pneumoniae TaxID=573 RepID=UPI0022B73F12
RKIYLSRTGRFIGWFVAGFALTATPFAANPSGAVRATVLCLISVNPDTKSPGGLLNYRTYLKICWFQFCQYFPAFFIVTLAFIRSPVESAIVSDPV